MTPVSYSGTNPVSAGGPNPSDAISLNVKVADAVAAPTDTADFVLKLTVTDDIAAPTDVLTLNVKLPAEPVVAPADARSFLVKVFLSGSVNTSQVTNPANADGDPNGTVATLQTAPAGATTAVMTSSLGSNVGAWAFTSAIYRGWFKSVTTLGTGSVSILLHSTTGLFVDKTMFLVSAAATTTDHLSGDFTFDLIAAGVDTLAKLQSCQVLHRTADAVAGATPNVLTVDAGCLELAGVFS
jgi:hypothetical protein